MTNVMALAELAILRHERGFVLHGVRNFRSSLDPEPMPASPNGEVECSISVAGLLAICLPLAE